MGILGTKNEPLLSEVLEIINGTSKSNVLRNSISKRSKVKDPLMLKRQVMFVEKKEVFFNQLINKP